MKNLSNIPMSLFYGRPQKNLKNGSIHQGMLMLLITFFTGLTAKQGFAQATNPTPFDLSTGSWTLSGWNTGVAAGSYPGNGATGADATTGVVVGAANANMVFHWFASEQTAVPTGNAGSDFACPYNLTGRPRVLGQGTNGFSFINTGSSQFDNCASGAANNKFLGAALLALNTTNRATIQVSWTGGTIATGDGSPTPREWKIRLQYRIGNSGSFTDLSGPVEYTSSTAGHSTALGPVTLPSACDNQPLVQVRWAYFQSAQNSGGTRPNLRIDDITVSSLPSGGGAAISVGSLTPGTAFSTYTGIPSAAQSFTVSGSSLTNAVTISAVAGYEYSDDGGSNWTTTGFTYGPPAVSKTISVRLTGVSNGTFNGTINIASTGASGSPETINLAGSVTTCQFTAGNLALVVAAENANNTTASVVEINTSSAGQSPVNTFDVSGTGTDAIRVSGSATSTLYLSNSNDGSLLCFTGHNSTNTGSNANTLNPRAVVAFGNGCAYSLAASYTSSSGNQTRAATTLNNMNWFIGDQGGIYTHGSSSGSPTGNFRGVKAFGATVYAQSSATVPIGILSAPSGGTLTALNGLTASGTNLQDFYLVSSAGNSTYDILYLLYTTKIDKYSLVSGSWVANGSYASLGGFGLAAKKQGTGAYLFVTTGGGAARNNSVIRLTDVAGHNATININTGDNVTLYTASGGAIIKGIAFSPVPAAPTVSGSTLSPGTSFSTSQGTPSDVQTFTLAGTYLSANLTVSAVAGYEYSDDGGSTWTTTGLTYSTPTVLKTISVRLTGASAGTFNGTITIASTGATNSPSTISLNGSVSNLASISTGTLTPGGSFSTNVGAPSAEQTFTVTGSFLSANVTVSAVAGYEYSDDGGSTWTTAGFTYPPPTVSKTISVRLTGALTGPFNGTITVASTGASGSPATVSLNGSVTDMQFTPGNIAIIVANASASNTTASILELNNSSAGQSPVHTYPVPGTGTNAMRFSGSATSTMYLSNNNDGSLLCFTGANSTNTSSNVNTLNPRAAATLNNAYAFTVQTTYTGSSGDQTRGTSSIDNLSWFIGDQGGFHSNGTTSPSPTGNVRGVKAFGGAVYAQSTATVPIGTISAATGGTLTGLNGLTASGTNLQDFYLVSSAGNTTYDILYLLYTTKIDKYSLVSGSWVANGSYASLGGFGLAAKKQGTGAYLFVTTGGGAATNNSVIRLTDIAGHNSTININTGDNVTLYTASGGMIIKGVAFAPIVPSPSVFVSALTPGTAFSTITGSPSATQSFSLSGVSLTGNLTVSTVAGYEYSDNGGSTWTTTGFTYPPPAVSKTILVRLTGASVGTFNGTTTIASAGATGSPAGISLSGTVYSALPSIVINEIMYNNSGADEEWVELYNPGATAVIINSGWSMTNSNPSWDRAFTGSYSIPAGGFATVRVGSNSGGASFPFTPNLSLSTAADQLVNSSSTITLKFGSTVIDQVTYSDASPWPTDADGNGPSVSLNNPASDNSLGANWGACKSNGTPGTANIHCSAATYYSIASGSIGTAGFTAANEIWSTTPAGTGVKPTIDENTSLIIQSSHTVTNTNSGQNVKNITVNSGGTLRGDNDITNPVYFDVFGNITNNGTIGTSMAPYNGISFDFEGINCTFSGSGTTNVARIRKDDSDNTTTNLTLNANITLRYAGTCIYNDEIGTTFNVTVAAGNTVTASGSTGSNGDISIDGVNGLSDLEKGGTFTVLGTLSVSGKLWAVSNNAVLPCNYVIGAAGRINAKDVDLRTEGSGIIGVQMNIASGGKLNVSGLIRHLEGIFNSNNGLVLGNDAILLHGAGTPGLSPYPGGTVTGNITVRRTGTSERGVYNYWSSPVQGAVLGVLTANGGVASNVYEYSPAGATGPAGAGLLAGWTGKSTSDIMVPAKGYIATEGGAVRFSGPVNNGDIPLGLVNGAHTSFNLVGNPYPGPLDVAAFLTQNSSQLFGSVHLWDDDRSLGGGYSGTDYIAANILGATTGGNGHGFYNGSIASGQGFFVEARPLASGLLFTNTMRTTTPAFFFEDHDYKRVWLGLSNDAGLSNETLLGFVPGATDERDDLYDARKIQGNSHIALYTVIGEEPYAIQAWGDLAEERVIPLGVNAALAGSYTFGISRMTHIDPTVLIYLEDMHTGTLHNLRLGDYSFDVTTPLSGTGRFQLIFKAPVTVTVTDGACNGNDGSVAIQPNGNTWKYDLVDAAQQTVATGNTTSPVTIENLLAGHYLLVLKTEDGYSTVNELDIQTAAITVSVSGNEHTDVGIPATFTAVCEGAGQLSWDFGDGTIAEQGSVVMHSYLHPGIYTVTLTGSNTTCSANARLTVYVEDVQTGIIQTGRLNVQLLPNPASDQLQIMIDNPEETEWILRDLSGKMLLGGQLLQTNNRIDLSGMANGMYLVTLQSRNGVRTVPLVVAR